MYVPDQEEAVIFPPGEADKNVPFGLRFGPSYFDSFANFPNAKYIVDIPMAKGGSNNTLNFARAAYNSIGADRIEQLEIGNEPNFYPGADRKHPYRPREYVKEWIRLANAVLEALGIDQNKPIFQAVALASPRYPVIGIWNV